MQFIFNNGIIDPFYSARRMKQKSSNIKIKVRLDDILDRVLSYKPHADIDIIKKAYVFSAKVHKGQIRLSGEPYLIHPIHVAYILANMQLDEATVATGLLHDTVEDTYATVKELMELFGKEISFLVDGVTKIGRFTFRSKAEQQAESFRKMILAMAKDTRVVLIKLADRLHNMKTLEFVGHDRQMNIAKETLDIYAPLANRLGIGWIKCELEDLSFKYLEHDLYENILSKINDKKVESDKYIDEVKDILLKKLEEYEIKGDISGRPKHIYSIYKKMQKQGMDFDKIYDILGFRIILHSIRECYEVLGVIHSLWKPVPGRFKDYIAMPKANMYQSLHTTVIGPYGERIEIQIRTDEMHRIAEEGVAAHWMYKEGKAPDGKDDKRFAWLRRVVEWQQDLKDPKEFLENIKGDLFPDEVYVFTPHGDVKEFPRGATPIDFAYSVHTEIGQRCVSAKVNDKIVPLRYELKNGDVVSIETSPNAYPRKDWLKFIKTSKARAKVRQWIKSEERESCIRLGRELCEKEFKKHGLNLSKTIRTGEFVKTIKDKFNIKEMDTFFASIGYGKISIRSVITKFMPSEHFEIKKTEQKVEKIEDEGAIVVKGVDDLMVRIAKCCNPLPGDSITGFITRGRGITVHSVKCHNMLICDSERMVEVKWDESLKVNRPVKIEIVCSDEKGVLADMSSAIAAEESNISNARIRTTEDRNAICVFEIQVRGKEHLNKIIKSLEKLKKVLNVTRLGN